MVSELGMFKKVLLGFFVLAICLNAVATISNLEVRPFVRLNEVVTISGDFTSPQVLCKFLILDSNGFIVERLTDEFTFDDGSFYSQRQVLEPPYYRGDDYNVFVTCGSSTDSNTFTVLQPLGVTHVVQMGWEYWFSEGNQDTIMIFVTFLGGIIIALLLIAFIIKKGREYAR